MSIPIDWLLSGEPWIGYRTRLDLLGEHEDSLPVQAARNAMLAQPLVTALVAELQNWPGVVLASHKSAGQAFHKLTFAADLGLKADDPGMRAVIARVLQHQSPEGPFQLPMQISAGHGGSGQETWAWALCDAPLTVYALVKLGLGDEAQVRKALEYLTSLVRENGWPCAVSKELGSFRGPGRKQDACPFASLAMLKALSEFNDLRESPAARAGVECLLNLWEHSMTEHPYIFYMGNDFRKLKMPFIWYDIMHVLDTLTRFDFLRQDARLLDMAQLLKRKMDAEGRFTPESVWMAWKEWEFGQKKEPSRWLTLAAWKILKRLRFDQAN